VIQTTTLKKGRLSFFSVILLLFNIGVLFLLTAGFLAAYVRPDNNWLFAFAGLLFPYAVLANLFFVLIWMFLWKKLFLISLLALLICWNRLTNYIQLDKKEISERQDAQPIKLMSYNVQIFDLYNWEKDRISMKGQDILVLLSDQKPDFLCLQEYHAGKRNKVDMDDSIKTHTGLKYSHIAFVNKGGREMPYGIATFSRWPVIKKQVINFDENPINFCIFSDIVVNDDTVRLFNVHLESIRLSREDYLYVEELPRNTDTQEIFSENSKKILRKFKRAYVNRTPQAIKVKEIINESPYPVIVCGDFNDTPSSYTYHHLSENLLDAFKESGHGVGMTYAGSLPSFRIDYILHDLVFESINFETLKINYSDHYPITTGIVLP
jgi:endonuclease/exonuclease/phosphatase family metal-dependent hydrolase